MQSVGSVLWRVLVVLGGGAGAYGLAQAMPTWETGLLVACTVLVAVGLVTDRMWAIAVIPVAGLLYFAGAFAIEPSSFGESHDAPGWFYALVLWGLGTFGSAVCVGGGVLIRRAARDHDNDHMGRRGPSRAAATL